MQYFQIPTTGNAENGEIKIVVKKNRLGKGDVVNHVEDEMLLFQLRCFALHEFGRDESSCDLELALGKGLHEKF